ncbi:MAG: bifunctional serine/threonine-protein kinase/formylglycine-generating enzyme family protein [Planctomycetota bacterium]|jgi:serine/threonine protein kinase/formylglycine-generating enzyme required for sulfatase activity
MAKITGRDLDQILRSVDKGDAGDRKRFTRPRLLRVFQDVCNAMAYAHDHSVIHRDLKPANIMVGEYGEVFVVDWGLAKIVSKPLDADYTDLASIDQRKSDSDQRNQRPPIQPDEELQDVDSLELALTIEGQVLGTPAYMAPEQAEGRLEDIDAQTDIYSLGAILYQILTFRPPFEGRSTHKVLSQVLTQEPTRPSKKASQIHTVILEATQKGEPDLMAEVPSELDEICLKALAKDKANRYGSAKELAEDIQLFLDGEKERRRNRERAVKAVGEGRARIAALADIRAQLLTLREEAKTLTGQLKPHWPVKKKKALWDIEEKIKAFEDEKIRTFTRAGTAFQTALGFVRGHAEARAGLADLYWDQYLREEEADNRSEMIRYENLVREYNDGLYDALLKGDGTLAVETRAYPCSCLSAGRRVLSDEMNVLGYHPLSGRAHDGNEGAAGLPEMEPSTPLPLRVHGPQCTPAPLDGADVWLFRFAENARILVPCTPEGESDPGEDSRTSAVDLNPPPEILDALYDPASPYRPAGEGRYLGKTPISKFEIPMGSYLLILAHKDYRPVRVPLHISRCAEEKATVTLYGESEIPEGFVQIPAGSFTYQGDKENSYSQPREIREAGDFFLATFPITCSEYLTFLNEELSRDPEGASLRAPREAEKAGFYWPKGEDGKFLIPTAEWLARAPASVKEKGKRLDQSSADWEAEWPVFSICWMDALAYARWRSERDGFLFSLPTETQWEKAARGTDGRFFPWGNDFDATFCNMNLSHEKGPQPSPVRSFPVDESPYGVRGLGGNSRDWCLDDPGEPYRTYRLLRGGNWAAIGDGLRASTRGGDLPTYVGLFFGGRLAWLPCTHQPPKADS